MKDERYLYLFRNNTSVTTLLCLPVANAEGYETELHRKYKADRFNMKSRRRSWWKKLLIRTGWIQEIKIGITGYPHLRIEQVAKDKKNDGYTEWFELNSFQVWRLKQKIKYYNLLYKGRCLFTGCKY